MIFYFYFRKDATELIQLKTKQMLMITMYCTYRSAAGYGSWNKKQ
jgi:hypothetical protein